MATTSRNKLILDTLRTYLSAETTFDVHKVFTKETFTHNTKTVIYVNIISDDLAMITAESRQIYDKRVIRVGIYAVARQSLDTTNAGTGAEKHGQVIEQIDKAIDNMASALPISDTTTAGYTVTLHSVNTAGVSGLVDDKGDKIPLLYEADIVYTMGVVA
jgi:hypothetical protein